MPATTFVAGRWLAFAQKKNERQCFLPKVSSSLRGAEDAEGTEKTENGDWPRGTDSPRDAARGQFTPELLPGTPRHCGHELGPETEAPSPGTCQLVNTLILAWLCKSLSHVSNRRSISCCMSICSIWLRTCVKGGASACPLWRSSGTKVFL